MSQTESPTESQTELDSVRQRVIQCLTESDIVRQSQTVPDRVRHRVKQRAIQIQTESDRVRQSHSQSQIEAENAVSLPGKSPETNDSRWRGKQSWRIFGLSMTIRGASYVLRRDDWHVP